MRFESRSSPLFRSFLFFIILFFVLSCSTTPRLGSDRYPVIKQGTKYYRVKKGDTLFAIAWRASLDYRSVAQWNAIPPPYTIYSGQIIKLFKLKQPVVSKKKASNNSSSRAEKKLIKSKSKKIPKNQKYLLKVRWQWPLRGVIRKTFSQTGGKGLDIAGKPGQAILAAAKGKIVYSGSGLIGYGNLIIVKHSEKFLSAYGNNRKLLAREGEIVRRGQKIAELGGNRAKKPELHFEIREYGKPVNPLNYLPKG